MSTSRAAYGYRRTDLAEGDAVQTMTLMQQAAADEGFLLGLTFEDTEAGEALRIVLATLEDPSVAALVVPSTEHLAPLSDARAELCGSVTVIVADPRERWDQRAAGMAAAERSSVGRSMWLTADPDDWGALTAAGKRITQKVTVVPVNVTKPPPAADAHTLPELVVRRSIADERNGW